MSLTFNMNGSRSENKVIITAIGNVGDTITISLNSSYIKSKTIPSGQSSVSFTVFKLGVWTVINGDFSSTINITQSGEYEITTLGHIFGIRRSLSTTSPDWERTDESSTFSATASVGDVAGSSDFDEYYPYNEITREVINGNTFVKIPKFWYQRYRDENYEYIKICSAARSGFLLHPAFQHNNTTQDYIYIGAYKMDSNYGSTSGTSVSVSRSFTQYRTGTQALGPGYGLIDVSSHFAVMMLILVEFATNNVQSAIGSGVSSGSVKITGSCDSVPNLTGRTSASVSDVVWRGIEGFWGNVFEYTDGLNLYGGKYYICNDQSAYASGTQTGYTQLSYSFITRDSVFYADVGYDENHPAYFLPMGSTTASATTGTCDALWSNAASSWYVAAFGGANGQGDKDGLFCGYFTDAQTAGGSNRGARMMLVPS